PPGRPESSRAAELLGTGLPTLVVQGGNDPFGKPAEFPPGGTYALVEVPYGDHGFAVPKRAPVGRDEALARIVGSVADWLAALR
ncbi:alpha/beta family hydrolase, partial [Streptomyces hydrogenans]